MDNYSRELVTLESERRMDELALRGVQHSIAEQLNGEMGRDMREVLSGNRKVTVPVTSRIMNWLRNILILIGGDEV